MNYLIVHSYGKVVRFSIQCIHKMEDQDGGSRKAWEAAYTARNNSFGFTSMLFSCSCVHIHSIGHHRQQSQTQALLCNFVRVVSLSLGCLTLAKYICQRYDTQGDRVLNSVLHLSTSIVVFKSKVASL